MAGTATMRQNCCGMRTEPPVIQRCERDSEGRCPLTREEQLASHRRAITAPCPLRRRPWSDTTLTVSKSGEMTVHWFGRPAGPSGIMTWALLGASVPDPSEKTTEDYSSRRSG